LRTLDADDLAFLAPSLPDAVFQEVYGLLDAGRASWVRSSIAHPEGSVGQLMSQELVAVRETQTLEEAVRDLRGRESLPPHFNALFIVDARNVLRGVLSLKELLLGPPDQPVSGVMAMDVVTFTPDEKAVDAAAAFERYDLLSAPVVDERGKLVGRLTVDAVMDFLRRRAEIDALKRAGLEGEEDIFAPVWDSARNRWLWLFVNLVTAFVASRVIGLFESTIGQLVALATLMPIVASIAGNTGNQTVALMIRALTLGQITPASTSHLVRKELTISLLNGAVWGTIVGLCAAALYGNLPLGGVMAAAILLNLVIGAMIGIAVPLVLHRVGRDPAQGASVLLTFTTDGMGFFIFLGLARVFLL
jgi:magnesium transporter